MMLIRHVGAALVAAHAVCGFKNASPFFVLSTETIDDSLRNTQMSTVTSFREKLLNRLSDCSASVYFLVQQPGLDANDLSDASSMPQMHRRMQDGDYKSSVYIPEMIGKLDLKETADRLSQQCGIKQADLQDYLGSTERPRGIVLTLELPPISANGMVRKATLQQADSLLDHQISSILTNHTSHVLLYTSSLVPDSGEEDRASVKQQSYEMDKPLSDIAMHTDLKRNIGTVQPRKRDDPQAGLPLFEKYQFLSPAIFMGLLVTVLLLVILNVGISAIAGLDVSYMAFSKDMGPQAQLKGKQQ